MCQKMYTTQVQKHHLLQKVSKQFHADADSQKNRTIKQLS